MLKRVTVTIAMFLTIFITTNSMYGQLLSVDKKTEKEIEKIVKEDLKEMKKNGWIIVGSGMNAERTLFDFYVRSQGKGIRTGTVSKCRSANICKNAAISSAQNSLVKEISAEIKGFTTELMQADLTTAEESNRFAEGFERAMSANVSGVLSFGYAKERDNGDGTKAFEVVMILDEEKLQENKKSAVQKALEKVDNAVKFKEKVSEFIGSSKK